MVVTYSYLLMGIFKMYATIIIRFNVGYINQPIIASDEEIIVKIETITHRKVKQIIDYY